MNKINWHREDGIGWIRFFGQGIYWKDVTKHRMLFSEEIGYTLGFKIGKWYIGRIYNGNEMGKRFDPNKQKNKVWKKKY